MQIKHETYLAMAHGAVSRRDFLSALQFGLRAAHVPHGVDDLRCDALLLLTLVSLELGAGEDALAFGVGAHLLACRAQDQGREERAAALVAMVIAHHPHLGEDSIEREIH